MKTSESREICRETTHRARGKMAAAYTVLLLICVSWAYEGFQFRATGHVSTLGVGMNLLWLGLWIWKVFYRYEVILRKTQLEIVTIGLWRQGRYIVDLSKTESFAQHYRHDFFRRTRIGHYPASATISTATTWRTRTRRVFWRSVKERGWRRSSSAAATSSCGSCAA